MAVELIMQCAHTWNRAPSKVPQVIDVMLVATPRVDFVAEFFTAVFTFAPLGSTPTR